MAAPNVRVVTDGSVWLIDEDGARYCRMPLTEKPRDPGPDGQDWGGPGAGPLEDLRWHSMTGWYLMPETRPQLDFTSDGGPVVLRVETGRQRLVITHDPDGDGHDCVTAPGAIVEAQ